jgi:ATP-dependent phosphofructokinase / diphosphate-dependent phosphofructokinase
MPKNILYAQSGGVTPVINASACAVIQTAKKYKEIKNIYAAKDGIIGILNEDLYDMNSESAENIESLKYTPAGAFGSCRYKLKSFEENKVEYTRFMEVIKAHDIGYFFYNGGGDSQDTANKLAQFSEKIGYPLTCIGIPKTIDNDLPLTDNSPGFGSVAKYVAVSIKEASLDVASMCSSSTKVFILEVMGRHAGWIAAAGGLAQETPSDGPHIILFPERPLDQKAFLDQVKKYVTTFGYASIVASEGLRNPDNTFLSESGTKDAFGHSQLGGVAPVLAQLVKSNLGYKYHWAVSDYLQRAARHIASQVDVDQAYAVGKAAVEFAMKGQNAIMPIIIRKQTATYSWEIGSTPLSSIANVERKLPSSYITEDGFHITKACREYIEPLIQGEAYPPYKNGLPLYARLKKQLVEKKLTQTSYKDK